MKKQMVDFVVAGAFCFVLLTAGCGGKKQVEDEEIILNTPKTNESDAAPFVAPASEPPKSDVASSGGGGSQPKSSGGYGSSEGSGSPPTGGGGYNPNAGMSSGYGNSVETTGYNPNSGMSGYGNQAENTGYNPGGGMSGYGAQEGNAGYNPGGGSGYGGGGNSGNQTPPEPAKPKSFKERAIAAFENGHEGRALRLMQAAIFEEEEGDEIAKLVRWAPSKNQPKLGIRVAVGVVLDAPDGVTDYKPIGSTQTMPTSGGRSGGSGPSGGYGGSGPSSGYGGSGPSSGYGSGYGGGGYGGSTGGGRASGSSEFEKLTGTLAKVLIEYFNDGHTEGNWGLAFKGTESLIAAAPVSSGGGGYGGGGPSSGYGSGGPSSGYGSGGPSSGYGSSYGGSNPSGGAAPRREEIKDEDNIKAVPIAAGLAFLGSDSQANLIKQAKAEGFDALIVFDVRVTVNRRNSIVTNEAKGKLVSLNDGKLLTVSKTFKNTDAQKDIEKSGESIIQKQLEPFLEKVGESTFMTDFPAALTPELLKSKRLGALIADRERPTLDILTEISAYKALGLITEAEASVAIDAVVGDTEAAILSERDEDGLQKLLQKWVDEKK